MQESFGMILLAIVNGQPRRWACSECHPSTSSSIASMSFAAARASDCARPANASTSSIGYQMALDHLDDVIRSSAGPPAAAKPTRIAEVFLRTDVASPKRQVRRSQASNSTAASTSSVASKRNRQRSTPRPHFRQVDAILELQLHRLTQLSVDEILKELKSIRDRIAELEEILASDKKLKQVIISGAARSPESLRRRPPHADRRRSRRNQARRPDRRRPKCSSPSATPATSSAPPPTPTATSRRGGKGRIGAKTREEDFVEHLFVASTHSYILLFTSKGRVYWLKVYEIPEAAAATRGQGHRQPREIPGRRKTHRARRRARSRRGRQVCLHGHARTAP